MMAKMFSPRSARNEQNPSFTVPTTRLKNITCIFCNRKFFVRDLNKPKIACIPLLLACGHASCQNCTRRCNGDRCPLCGSLEQTDSKVRSLPPLNVYILGLANIYNARPNDEPDISFHQTAASTEHMDRHYCVHCYLLADLRCYECNILFCRFCYKESHGKFKMNHRTTVLQNNGKDSIFQLKVCTEHDEAIDYYCNDCHHSSCHHCMLLKHQRHDIIPHTSKNEEYIPAFEKVKGKMATTLQRIHQTQKEVQNLLRLPELLKKNEIIESAINKHFAYLHGVLQNIESRLVYNLQEQCRNVTENLNEIQARLNVQEGELHSALLIAAYAKDITSRMNLQDVIPKLEELSNSPCHLVQDKTLDNENIVFCPDPSIVAALENHCKIDVPEIANYNLLPEDALPEGHELKALTGETSISMMDRSITSDSSMMTQASSRQLLVSNKLETQPLRRGGFSLVKICHVEHPSNFYVRRVAHEQKMAELNEMLHNYASQTDSIPDNVELNTLYAVKHGRHHKWYRGRINSVSAKKDESDMYVVFDVDSGRTEHQVPKERLRNITKALETPAPMVVNCALFDIVPKNGKWTPEACKALADYQQSSEYVMMHVVNIKGTKFCVDLSKDHLGNNCVTIRDYLIYSDCAAFSTAHQLIRRTPKAVRRFYREDMTVNAYHNVKVTHVESPDCIYVQKLEDHYAMYLDKMSTLMNVYYNERVKSKEGIIHVPEIGLPCAVEETEGVWRRAIITGVTGSRKVSVILVDFGPTITTGYDNIRKLSENFMAASTQAIKVSLADIDPINTGWTEDAIALISAHFQHPFGQLFAFERQDDVYTVILYTAANINVGTLLVEENLAISTGPRSTSPTIVAATARESHNCTNKVRNKRTVNKQQRAHVKGSRTSSSAGKNDPFKLRVKIIRVESPDTIYVADPSNDTSYERMMEEMQRFYSKNALVSKNTEWKTNAQCAVYLARYGQFFRGKIVGFNSPQNAEVFLYDLSFTEIIPVGVLQPLKKKFWATRTYAFKVKLAGIYPCGGSSAWLETSCLKLKDLIDTHESSQFYISTVDGIGKDDLNVELWVEQVKVDGPLAPTRIEINSVNRLLVEDGFALPIKLYNEKKTNILAAELKKYISCIDDEKKAEEKKTNVTLEEKNQSTDSDSNSPMNSTGRTMVSSPIILSSDEDIESVASSVVTLTSNGDSSVSHDALLTTTEKPTEWLPPETITDDIFTAIPTNLDNDCCVYLHSVHQSAQTLRLLEKTLLEKYDSTKPQPRDLVWEQGEICIAQYHANNKWYRAQVHRVLSNNMIEVEFIDYGNIEECENYRLRKDVVLTNIPRQGAKCVISGLFPNTKSGKWAIPDLDRIHALLIDRECKIVVRDRYSDHLEVAIILTNKRCELTKYLRCVLRLNIRTSFESSSDNSNSTINADGDVIIDGYINDDELSQELDCDNNDGETKGNVEDAHDEGNYHEESNRISSECSFIDNCKDSIPNCEEKHGGDDRVAINYLPMDAFVSSEIPASSCTSDSEMKILADEEDSDNEGDKIIHDVENSTFITNDPILAGTANFTCNAEDIEMHQEIAMGELECMSLPDTMDGPIPTSTPHNVTFDTRNSRWKYVEIPEEVKVVKAEVGKIGIFNLSMHLLDNKSSKVLSDQRNKYNAVMLDMQVHAKNQPLLVIIEEGSLCCAKFADGVWYRCQVLGYASEPCKPGYTIQVQFVDYGNEAYVGSNELRVLKEEWIEAPVMSLHCNLWNVALAASGDFAIICAKIRSVYTNKPDIEDRSPPAFYVKIDARLKKTYDVEIYRDEECTELVYQSIIDEGLYVKITDV